MNTIDDTNSISEITALAYEDIPDLKRGRNPERMMISLPRDDFQKLRMLKNECGKDPQELIRMLIRRFLEQLPT